MHASTAMRKDSHGIAVGGGTLGPSLNHAPHATATTRIDGMKLFKWPTCVCAQRAVCTRVQRGALVPISGVAAALHRPKEEGALLC